MTRLRRLELVVVILFVGPVAVRCESLTTRGTVPACATRGDLELMESILADGDRLAATRLLAQGRCVSLPAASQVHLLESSFLGGAVKVRRTGQPDGFWIPRSAISTRAEQRRMPDPEKFFAERRAARESTVANMLGELPSRILRAVFDNLTAVGLGMAAALVLVWAYRQDKKRYL